MLPVEFINRMKEMLKDEFDSFINSYNEPSCKSLRINTLKVHTSQFFSCRNLSPVSWCDAGFYYDDNITPGKHPYHEAGVYYIQEASAMLPAKLLDARPGEKVLDLCAAPGGKSTEIASSMNGEGLLISNEIIPSRAKILSENIERMGIRNAIVTNESSDMLAERFPEYFDKIMVDAPCSGEGMFRKNPEACDEWSPENVEMCADRQLEIMENASIMLAPGGRIVYSTCTFAPPENEGTIYRFLKSHPEFHVVKPDVFADEFDCEHSEFKFEKPDVFAGGFDSEHPKLQFEKSDTSAGGFDCGHPEWIKEFMSDNEIKTQLKFCVRLCPHKVRGEGHFACILEKDTDEATDRYNKTEHGVDPRKLKEYFSFEKEYLNIHFDGPFIKFGEQLYLLPNNTPLLKGIKVLRAGLHLGTFMKNRFEPSHALALALALDDVKYAAEIDLETAKQYISGQTFSCDSNRGWNLITVDGFSLGWGKCSGGIMKNHYPKGLRKTLIS